MGIIKSSKASGKHTINILWPVCMERQEHLTWPGSFSRIKNDFVNPSALKLGKDPDRSYVHPDK
jgi:hypothetical protein